MFGKQTKKKAIEEVPKVEESVDLEIEDAQEEVIEEESKEKIKFNAAPEKIASAQEKIKELEQELEEAKTRALEEEAPKDFMTVNAVEIVGEGIYKYTLIATKPLWNIGAVIKLQ